MVDNPVHYCHAYKCEEEVNPKMLMCKKHWFMVPKELRTLIWRHYRNGQEIDKRPSEQYTQVQRKAVMHVAKMEGYIN